MRRVATCSCGELRVTCEGEPVRLSVCHCLDCQKRTGSAFGAQARFPESRVQVEGSPRHFSRTADSGALLDFGFCAGCGSTVFYINSAVPGFVGVAVGCFADPSFGQPRFSVHESRRHGWAVVAGDDVEHTE